MKGSETRSLQQTITNPAQQKLPLNYFLLVLVLSLPFYLVGGGTLPLPMNLPVSALMGITPLLAASILASRQHGITGVKQLLMKTFDYRKIGNKTWYLPILFLSPLIYLMSYVVMRLLGLPLPDPKLPILLVPVFFLLFFIEAACEELGWMGYAIDPTQDRWDALKGGIVLGVVWQMWHIIPDLQAHHTPDWIFWHDLQGVALRVLMVWVYNNTGKSVFSAILIHTMDNVSWSLFPNFGSGFDPFFAALFTCLAAGMVIVGWGAKTLAQFREARGTLA